ncbi:hypothetical protein E1212_17980 [Jiangella ureilytica]|uniref:WD40 repeat domain-containing protein n=1 Tax=Jiangella ureilytica TaxID=2530374 RepID=A0A4R4RJ09_9ACTN|nr:hypothetical protein [Jiangella ureilytica]TDC49561.1 hypothetical protein E1212_17980 [Jiangella ureilytica]
MTLEDHLRDALDDLVTRVPPRAGLADAVLREANRRRAKVRLATAGTTVAAVAAGTMFVVADPLAVDGADLGTIGPAAREPADAGDPGPGTVDLDVAGLAEGPAPAGAPWITDGVLRVDDQEFALPDDISRIQTIEAVAGGVAVLTVPPAESPDGSPDLRLLLLSPDGGRTELGDGPIYGFGVSADRTLIAWARHDWATHAPDGGPGRTLLYVADAATGEVLHERVQSGDGGSMGSVRGFLGDGRVLLDAATNAPTGLALWDPEADTVTPWTGYGFANAVSPGAGLAVLSPTNEAANRVPAVVDADGETRWELPPDTHVPQHGFSPDGRHLAVIVSPGLTEAQERAERRLQDEGGYATIDVPRSVVVFDAVTGERELTVDGTEPGTVTWEPDGSLVFEVWNDDRTVAGLVRCSLDGRCELAARPQDVDGGRLPYLGGGL